MFHVEQSHQMIDVSEHIKSILQRIPQKPGVYQYFNTEGTIIYLFVGDGPRQVALMEPFQEAEV